MSRKGDVTTWAKLNEALETAERLALEKLAHQIKELLEEAVLNEVYSHTPSVYERTEQLFDSIDIRFSKVKGGLNEAFIYFNPSKIKSTETEGLWNQHMSIDGKTTWEGIPVNELVPMIIEMGNSGSLYDRKGTFVARDTGTKVLIESLDIKSYKDTFKKLGFKVDK